MKYKILFMDIDGTLRDDQGQISKENEEGIRWALANGLEVVLCSGRCVSHVKKLSQQLGITNYLIASNGTEIYDINNNSFIYRSIFNKEDVTFLYKLVNNDIKMICNCGLKKYVNIIDDDHNEIIVDHYDTVMQNTSQVVIQTKQVDKIKEIQNLISHNPNISVESASPLIFKKKEHLLPRDLKRKYYYIDIINCNDSKGNGVLRLLNYMNIHPSEAVVIGNDLNDLSMFRHVGLKVAVNNADQELKNQADLIVSSNNDNAIYDLITKISNRMI